MWNLSCSRHANTAPGPFGYRWALSAHGHSTASKFKHMRSSILGYVGQRGGTKIITLLLLSHASFLNSKPRQGLPKPSSTATAVHIHLFLLTGIDCRVSHQHTDHHEAKACTVDATPAVSAMEGFTEHFTGHCFFLLQYLT